MIRRYQWEKRASLDHLLWLTTLVDGCLTRTAKNLRVQRQEVAKKMITSTIVYQLVQHWYLLIRQVKNGNKRMGVLLWYLEKGYYWQRFFFFLQWSYSYKYFSWRKERTVGLQWTKKYVSNKKRIDGRRFFFLTATCASLRSNEAWYH